MLDVYQEDQKIVYHTLKNAIDKDRTSHAYLFESNGYKDALPLAISFAKGLLCPMHYTNNEKCTECKQCHNIDTHNFLELKIIKPDGMWIKKEQLDELQKEFHLKSVIGSKKIYIIEEAEKLNASSANTILKFLEEPPENIVAILLTDNIYQMLETIISRCQVISLRNKIDVNEKSIVEKISQVVSIPEELVDEEKIKDVISHICQFIQYCETKKMDTLLYTQRLWHEVIVGKELNLFAFDIMILFYKDLLNIKIGKKAIYFTEEELSNLQSLNTIDQINQKLKIVLEIKEQVKYNANANLLIDRLVIELVGGAV